MPLPKFEDWRRPWKDGELDEEKAARLIYNLKREVEENETKVTERDEKLETLQTELDEERARKADPDADVQQELKDLRKENRTLKEDANKPNPEHQKELDRLNDVIDLVDKGLPKAVALRVQGDDTDARLEDAKSLAQVMGIEDFGEDSGGGEGGEGENEDPSGAPQRQPQSQLRSGFERGKPPAKSDPKAAAKVLESVPLFS